MTTCSSRVFCITTMPVSTMKEEQTVCEFNPVKTILKANVFTKLTLASLGLAYMCHLAGIGSSYWVVGSCNGTVVWHEGLWQRCHLTPQNTWRCVSYDVVHHLQITPAWVLICQGLSVLGALVAFPAVIVALFYALHPTISKSMGARMLPVFMSSTVGLFTLTTTVVFRVFYPALPDYSKQSLHFHWAYAVEILASTLFFMSPIFYLTDIHKTTNEFS